VRHETGSESVVRERARGAAQWGASCAADDALRRRIGLPCIVCREAIAPTDVEREVGVGIVMRAHEACYKLWRAESKRDAGLRRLAS
jgi:hypothetical protein